MLPSLLNPNRDSGRGSANTADGPSLAPLPVIGGGRGASSPRKGSPRGRRLMESGLPPLSVPPDDVFVDPGPTTATESPYFGAMSPLGTPREIRARPIDIEKEIPLLFVDDSAEMMASGSPYEGGSMAQVAPLSRQHSAGGMAGSSLLNVLAPTAAGGGADINIPHCVLMASWEVPLAARKFRRPAQMIRYRPTPSHERVAEYELDDEDCGFLAELNSGCRQPLLDEDRLEALIDALEKSSFRALHQGQAQRLLLPTHAPLPVVPANSLEPILPMSSSPAPRRRDMKRPSAGLPSPTRPAKTAKQAKPDRPPPPSDTELLHLPAGLCRRYQQGRCHKGRSCKWKHEIWPELQARWGAWQNPDGGAAAPSASTLSPAHLTHPSQLSQSHQSALSSIEALDAKSTEDDPLGALALSELGVTSALEMLPPALVARAAGVSASAAAAVSSLVGSGVHHVNGAVDDLGLNGMHARAARVQMHTCTCTWAHTYTCTYRLIRPRPRIYARAQNTSPYAHARVMGMRL